MELHDKKIERCLIGSLLIDSKAIYSVVRIIQPNDFFEGIHRIIYDYIIKKTRDGQKTDLVIMSKDLESVLQKHGGTLYLVEMTTEVVTASNVVEYANRIKQLSIRRELVNSSDEIKNIATKDVDIDLILSDSRKIISSIGYTRKPKTNQETIAEVLEARLEGKVKGIPTGLEFLDRYTLGYKSGHVWVIGAYSGYGKTTFALELAKRVYISNKTWYFSLEMPVADVQDRLLHFYELESVDLGMAADKIAYNQNFRIFDDCRTVRDIEAYYEMELIKPKIIFIDYIGIMEGDGNEYERITTITRELQKFAMLNGVCIVELSQINEESQKSQNKTFGFKGSGSVGNDANVAIRLEMGDADVDIVSYTIRLIKNRHGRKANYECEFDKERYRFIFPKLPPQ